MLPIHWCPIIIKVIFCNVNKNVLACKSGKIYVSFSNNTLHKEHDFAPVRLDICSKTLINPHIALLTLELPIQIVTAYLLPSAEHHTSNATVWFTDLIYVVNDLCNTGDALSAYRQKEHNFRNFWMQYTRIHVCIYYNFLHMKVIWNVVVFGMTSLSLVHSLWLGVRH